MHDDDDDDDDYDDDDVHSEERVSGAGGDVVGAGEHAGGAEDLCQSHPGHHQWLVQRLPHYRASLSGREQRSPHSQPIQHAHTHRLAASPPVVAVVVMMVVVVVFMVVVVVVMWK